MKRLVFAFLAVSAVTLAGCGDKPKPFKPHRGPVVKPDELSAESLIAAGDQAFLGAKNYERAAYYYEKALKKAPNNLHTLYHYGKTLRFMGQDNIATQYFETYIKIIEEEKAQTYSGIGKGKLPKEINEIELIDVRDHIRAIRYLKEINRTRRDFAFLIDCLEDRFEEIRQAAIDRLMYLTDRKFDYWARGPENERADSVRRWREWYTLTKSKGSRKSRRARLFGKY